MKKKTLIKIMLSIAFLIVVLSLSFPWILYGIGLGNINGRPAYASTALIKTEAEELWKELRETGPVKIDKIGPWDYVFLLTGKDRIHSGECVAWYVARNYNYENLKDKRMGYWHLSGASLTIWLMNNWTAQQLLAKANEIKNGLGVQDYRVFWRLQRKNPRGFNRSIGRRGNAGIGY